MDSSVSFFDDHCSPQKHISSGINKANLRQDSQQENVREDYIADCTMERKSGGCWTCKIRHRKCDQSRPHCNECYARQLPCHGYGPQPVWFSDPERLHTTLREIKRTVKISVANAKRSRRNSESRSTPTDHAEVGANVAACAPPDPRGTIPSNSPSPLTLHESQLLMYYFDHIFRLQLPYDQDQPDVGGRAWLFWIALRRGPVYRALLTLAALHKSLRMDRSRRSPELDAFEYHSRALMTLRESLEDRMNENFHICDEQLMDCIGSGLMLISFEVGSLGVYRPKKCVN